MERVFDSDFQGVLLELGHEHAHSPALQQLQQLVDEGRGRPRRSD